MEFKTIDQIKPYEKNAKLHPKWHIEKIATSIKQFGCKQPIVIDKDGILVAGHGRFEAMTKLLGYTQLEEKGSTKKGEAVIPFILADDLTEDEVKAYRLADNQLNALTGVDTALVIEELKELDLAGFDMEITGFDRDLIIEGDDNDDEVPESPVVTQSMIGDLYELGGHRILCGDSTKPEDMDKLFGDARAKMVVTDPPYNIAYKGGGEGGKGKNPRKEILNDKMSSEDFYKFLFNFISNASKKTKGAFYIFMSNSELHTLWKAFTDAKCHWQTYIIWAKDRFTLSRTDYQQQTEPFLVGHNADDEELGSESEADLMLYGWNAHEWYGGRKQGNVWHIPRPKKSDLHPTMKPVALYVKAITNSSRRGDIVLDCFLGSGTNLIACEKTGRICYATELDPEYIDKSVERWCRMTGIRNIKKNGQDIIWNYEEAQA